MDELLEITLGFFFQFQPLYTIFQHNPQVKLQDSIMFTTFLTQVPQYQR